MGAQAKEKHVSEGLKQIVLKQDNKTLRTNATQSRIDHQHLVDKKKQLKESTDDVLHESFGNGN